MSIDEYWLVQKSGGKGHFREWRDSTDGPHALYDDEAGALDWAQKLALIHDHVRIVRIVKTYHEVK